MRLAKYLARCGVASRRASERLVVEGRVAVAGQVVKDPARDVDARFAVTVDGRRVSPEEVEVWALNKPPGVVSTARDTHGRPTVVDLVPSASRLYPVGRLDAETTGLILLTNDGELAELLTHPRHGVEKTYRARVEPAAIPDSTLAALRSGVHLDDGPAAASNARRLEAGLLELTIAEGRKRQVRRMCEAVGHRVTALERVAFGPLSLEAAAGPAGGLAPGRSRRLARAEVERLRAAAGAALPRRS
jgi:23S rRNA pseudouridine2605 synthase